MSKCDLEIALDRPDRTYAPGDTVRGFVGVTVNRDSRCNGIRVTREWRTHGSGNRATGDAETITLAEGDLKAGEKQLYPFEFTLPAGPVTYHGHHLNVDWYVAARADIPWAIDPKAEEELILVPGDGEQLHGPRHRPGAPPSHAATPVFMTAFGATFAGVAAMVGCVGVVGVLSDGGGWGAVPFLVIPAVFAAVGLLVIWLAWKNRIAERRLGPITVTVTPESAREGDEVTIDVAFTPTAAVRLEGVTATLAVRERCVSGSGTDKRTWTHQLHRETAALAGATALEPGRSTSLRATLRLPSLAAPSFAAPSNELGWIVSIAVGVAGWPDWSREHVLTVRP